MGCFFNMKKAVRPMGHLGFSYVGLIFLLMLFIPNILWAKNKPEGYSPDGENKVLLAFERAGEILATASALIFDDFNFHGWTTWTWWLILAFAFMVMYILWWVRYFRSKKELQDFYSGFLGIPGGGPARYRFLPIGNIWESYLDAGCGSNSRYGAYRHTFAA
jgi:hypothetical protein